MDIEGEGQVGEIVEVRNDAREVVERVVVDRTMRRVVFEDGGDRDLGIVERVLDQPSAAPDAMDAALRLGVHHPPAGVGIEGQVDADAAQLAGLSGHGACARGWRGACAVAAAIAGAGGGRAPRAIDAPRLRAIL
ncbi:MAG: hypothetical protein OXG04_24385 [Acidobacteria bacterium]|nr:hypothetical protein [Acidobacteriota bacterium]